jgi:hypothetical protein
MSMIYGTCVFQILRKLHAIGLVQNHLDMALWFALCFSFISLFEIAKMNTVVLTSF